MKSIREIQEWLDARTFSGGEACSIRNMLVLAGYSEQDFDGLAVRVVRTGQTGSLEEFGAMLAEDKEPSAAHGRMAFDRAFVLMGRLMSRKVAEMRPELEAAAAAMGYDPAELGVHDFGLSFGEEKEESGIPHVYRIFFRSGERHDVVADDVELEDTEDEDGNVTRETIFRLDGRIVAKSGDVEFVILDQEEDDED